ncbi:NUDIX hydrolase [Nonomuraea sp. NPDC050663]|uniref:NUDIX hydrolase n=1 Tax=Nonomuraea sp. NPDC050663 TaxID=3364370 RepID=UPI0037A1F54A
MTVSREHISATLTRYLATHPDRAGEVARLQQALATSDDLSSRSTFPLHVTAGAVAIDDTNKVLMIHHLALNRWLLPGGHLEPSDTSLYGAALRELEEETGLPWQHAVSPPSHDLIPVDIDIHAIPANPAKGEPDHWHADFRFAFWTKPTPLSIQPEEILAYDWRDRSELPTPQLVARVHAI